MPQPPARLITYAWGKEYVDKLLTFTLGSVLAPGNLPTLAGEFDATVVILTEKRFFGYVENHPTSKRIASICPLRLLPLDDIIGQPWQYGISLAYALFRGFAELGPAMTDTYLLFLNADFVLADGSYKSLIPHMLRGEPALLAPSYCTVAEGVAPILTAQVDPRTQALALPPRELAGVILEHRHNTIRAKTVNQQLFHFEYMDQSYWEVDAHTLLGHQMPISLVAMRPEVALDDLSTFWDWGIVYDFCPSKRLSVLGDSDDFLMLELREAATHLNLIRMGATTPQAAASRMLGYITQYQIDAGRYPLTLRSGELSSATAPGHAALQRFVDGQIEHLTLKPKNHYDHPDWLYHKEHLHRYHEQKALAATQPQTEADLSAESCVDAEQPASSTICSELSVHPLVHRAPTSGSWKHELLRRMVPPSRPWHPMYLAYRNTVHALRKAHAGKPRNTLFIGSAGTPLARLIGGFPGMHYTASPAFLHNTEWDKAVAALPAFGMAVIELSSAELPHAQVIFDAVARPLRDRSPVILSWVNSGEIPADSALEQSLIGLMTLCDADADVRFESSSLAQRAIAWAQWAWQPDTRAGRIARGSALVLAAAWALVAAFGYSLVRRPSVASVDCLSLTVLIEQKPPPHSAIGALPRSESSQPVPELLTAADVYSR